MSENVYEPACDRVVANSGSHSAQGSSQCKPYVPSRMICDFHVRGVQYWDAHDVFNKLEIGTQLSMYVEPSNPHDSQAVAVYVGEHKLGYVPRELAGLLSDFIYYGHGAIFEAYILSINPEAVPYKQIRVGVYVVDSRS